MDTILLSALESFASTGAMPLNPPLLGKVHRLGILDHKTPAKRAGEIAHWMKEYRHLCPGPTLPATWTPATLTNGKECEVKVTLGKGIHQGKEYLHLRVYTIAYTHTYYKQFTLDLQTWNLTRLPDTGHDYNGLIP